MQGVQANREKAEGWLAKNAIIVTALNPLIGYAAGAALVKEAGEGGLWLLPWQLKKPLEASSGTPPPTAR